MEGTLAVVGEDAVDHLVNTDPLALLIGMVLDQQIPMEKAFRGPFDLRERMGGQLDARAIAEIDRDEMAVLFKGPPAIHRFPGSMAGRVQDACRVVADEYGNDAGALWQTAETGGELLRRLQAVPGFGKQKAQIFLALLAKRFAVRPPGWEEAAGPYAERGSHKSVADIDSPAAFAAVRAHKRETKAAAKAKQADPAP